MGDNAAGVLDFAFRMRPGTKRVALVGGTAPNNVYSEQVFRKGLEPYLEKLELIDLTKLSDGGDPGPGGFSSPGHHRPLRGYLQ